jgi:indoleamine 2,3-dioxygenase
MAEAGLPHGVIYDDGSGTQTYRQYSGGSNAQSSLNQFFDIVLGVEHRPTGERLDPASESEREGRAPRPRHNFIMEMRRYMPGPHARFLGDVTAVANIRDFVEEHGDADPQLRIAYDACLSMLSALRDKHINIVTRYIVIPSREVRARSRSRSPEAARRRVNLATASRQPRSSTAQHAAGEPQPPVSSSTTLDERKRKNLKGTGGTALIAFLKQARDETGEPAVDEWARRFMRRQVRSEGKGDFFLGKQDEDLQGPTEEVEVTGLAGTWTVDDDVGGICQY